MGYPTVRLEATGLDPLVLSHSTGWAIQALDLGDASTRTAVQDAPDADGTIDTTEFIGARVITMSLKLLPAKSGMTKEAMRRRLRAFTHPRLRPLFYVALDGLPEMRATVRRSAFTNVIQAPAYAPVTIQFVAPNGVLESGTLSTFNANISASALSEGGRTYNQTYDKVYAGGGVNGQITVTNAGNADAYPLLRIYGPCVNPIVTNATTGEDLAFTGITIAAGEFLEIDTRAKTIFYLGNSTDSRYQYLDFATSEWWSLHPGTNLIRFHPQSGAAPSTCEINYRDAWL